MTRALEIIILSLVLAIPAMAADMGTGTFLMYPEPHHKVEAGCDHGTKLTLDNANLNGNVAFLENFLKGGCEIFVPANPRMFKIAAIKDDGCGSKVYTGSFQSSRGTVEIEIVDNRGRMCENMIAALIVVTEKTPEGSHTLYSLDE